MNLKSNFKVEEWSNGKDLIFNRIGFSEGGAFCDLENGLLVIHSEDIPVLSLIDDSNANKNENVEEISFQRHSNPYSLTLTYIGKTSFGLTQNLKVSYRFGLISFKPVKVNRLVIWLKLIQNLDKHTEFAFSLELENDKSILVFYPKKLDQYFIVIGETIKVKNYIDSGRELIKNVVYESFSSK